MKIFSQSQSGGSSSLPDPVNEAHGGTNQTTYAKGDIIHATATNTLGKLAIGTQGQSPAVQSTGLLAYEDFLNLSKYSIFFDDFLAGGNSQLASPNFVGSASGAGAAVASSGLSSNGASAAHPGTCIAYTGTTSTGYAQAYSDARNANVFVGGGSVYYETCVYLPVLSDGTNTYTCRFGIFNQAVPSTAIVTGIYFTYTHSANGGKWLFNSTSASTTSTSDTGTAVAATTWYKLGFVVNAAGTSIQAYVNGSAAGSAITTNIPGAVGTCFVFEIYNSAGTSGTRVLTFDYVRFVSVLTTAR